MPEKRPPRKLAVILHADVVGSTTLVQRDETLAHERIRDAFRRLSESVGAYGGVVHETRGDALVAEFARASDAVCAALRFQSSNATLNAQIGDEIVPAVRIGIALGEEVIADDTVTGTGVVLAQRVEQLSRPGGVCVTAAIYEALPQRLPFAEEGLGEQRLKGIDKPVRVYRVSLEPGGSVPAPESGKGVPSASKGRPVLAAAAVVALLAVVAVSLWLEPWAPREEAASVERMAYPLPDKPSIAVLPFENMSGDPGQEYFADGLTENVITTVSQLPDVFVIARNSTFAYKGQPVKVHQVAEDLGVRYVLEGSFQRTEDRVRVHAQFIDALSGRHLWAERFDHEWSDVFVLQDELTERIVSSLKLKLSEEQRILLSRHYTNDPEAYEDFLRGQSAFYGYSVEDNARARELYERAVARDPDFARAVAAVALTHAYDFRFGWSDIGEESLARAQELSRQALDMDETLPQIQLVAGAVAQFARDHSKAIEAGRRALALDHSYADAYALVAFSETYVGNATEAIELMEKAMRLNPNPSSLLHVAMGRALFFAERPEQARRHLQRAVELNPEFLLAHIMLAAAWSESGDQGEAEWEVEEVLVLSPDFSIDRWLETEPLVYEPYVDKLRTILLRAGFPE